MTHRYTHETYLGDGLYASYEDVPLGGQFKLRAPRDGSAAFPLARHHL